MNDLLLLPYIVLLLGYCSMIYISRGKFGNLEGLIKYWVIIPILKWIFMIGTIICAFFYSYEVSKEFFLSLILIPIVMSFLIINYRQYGKFSISYLLFIVISLILFFIIYISIFLRTSIDYSYVVFFSHTLSIILMFFFVLGVFGEIINQNYSGKEGILFTQEFFRKFKYLFYILNLFILLCTGIYPIFINPANYTGIFIELSLIVADLTILLIPTSFLKRNPFLLFCFFFGFRLLLALVSIQFWFLGITAIFIVLIVFCYFNTVYKSYAYDLASKNKEQDPAKDKHKQDTKKDVEKIVDDLLDLKIKRSTSPILNLGFNIKVNPTIHIMTLIVLLYCIFFLIGVVKGKDIGISSIMMLDNQHEEWVFAVFAFSMTFVVGFGVHALIKVLDIPTVIIELLDRFIQVDDEDDKGNKEQNIVDELVIEDIVSFIDVYKRSVIRYTLIWFVIIVVNTLILYLITKSFIILVCLPSVGICVFCVLFFLKLVKLQKFSLIIDLTQINGKKQNKETDSNEAGENEILNFDFISKTFKTFVLTCIIVCFVLIIVVTILLKVFIIQDIIWKGYLIGMLLFVFNWSFLNIYSNLKKYAVWFYVLISCNFVIIVFGSVLIHVGLLSLLICNLLIVAIIHSIAHRKFVLWTIIVYVVAIIGTLIGVVFVTINQNVLFIVASVLTTIVFYLTAYTILKYIFGAFNPLKTTHIKDFSIQQSILAIVILISMIIIGVLIAIQGQGVFWGISLIFFTIVLITFWFGLNGVPIFQSSNYFFNNRILPSFIYSKHTKTAELNNYHVLAFIIGFILLIFWIIIFFVFEKFKPHFNYTLVLFLIVIGMFLACLLKLLLTNFVNFLEVEIFFCNSVEFSSNKSVDIDIVDYSTFKTSLMEYLKDKREVSKQYLSEFIRAFDLKNVSLNDLQKYLRTQAIYLSDDEMKMLPNEEILRISKEYKAWIHLKEEEIESHLLIEDDEVVKEFPKNLDMDNSSLDTPLISINNLDNIDNIVQNQVLSDENSFPNSM
eukprot:TRINITY_DN1072_c0_g1_i1.p1 TRINITY_DN1072_c0_g1~~TRINITY_DN1072_c0_g1_i1.p1  ORF type:complete len:1010 (-),score=207.38 TRINITY_DN1072_c0_g1_i1:4-3033(-)